MGIYIKGLDMPKDATSITVDFWDKDDMPVGWADVETDRIISIPTPHGRLIDAEDVKKKWEPVSDSLGTLAITECYFGSEWADELVDVPTILEAEE